jgi:type I restriction enzyme S subunit
MLIPLPPLEEQRRIVAPIEQLMARVREARSLRQQALEEVERLWQSVLADTFARPGSTLPPGWRWVRLWEIFDLQQGASMSPKRRGRNPKPFLRPKNVLLKYH